MKKLVYSFTVILLFTFGNISCEKADTILTDGTEVTSVLTETEIDNLLTLREEEKLARDVYMYSYEKYGINVSTNIASSEQTHMDRVLTILNTYGIADPASSERGVFNNSELQVIYDALIAQVDLSSTDAMLVGATIEDLDIMDIEEFKQNTIKSDLLDMYSNLTCGSRNHLRSYYSQILSSGETYTPQYISQDEFNAIIESDKERCGM